MLVGLDHDRRHRELAQQFDEIRRKEARVANLDGMTDRPAIERLWQEREKAGEVRRIELLGRRHLPEHRTELRLQFQHAAGEEPLYRGTGLGQHAAVGRELRTLEREHEIVRRLGCPFAEAVRLLRAIEGAVDLDAAELAARIFEFTRVRQPLRIELAAPRLEHPAADADPDHARTSPLPFRHGWAEDATSRPRTAIDLGRRSEERMVR